MLEERYKAYVTALSSRMHAVVDAVVTDEKQSTITVRSPQFASLEWKYTVDENFQPTEAHSLRNPFIEATIFTCAAYGSVAKPYNITITLYSDPGYHTRDDTVAQKSLDESRTFLYHKKPITEVEKTGLGSSAGLVTVLTASLICFFTQSSLEACTEKIHNCAQIAHCLAQKKVGSGFDVATAVYGSIVYNRFAPNVVNDLYEDKFFAEKSASTRNAFVARLQQLVNKNWEFGHVKRSLPPGIRLLMGDIKGGSETPKLVSKVLKWKTEHVQESEALYHNLDTANNKFMLCLATLTELYRTDQKSYEQWLASLNQKTLLDVSNPFYELASSIKDIRKYLRELTSGSGAEIEPQQQTKLLDDCSTIDGCLGGVVPGAGGYDAICLFVSETALPSFIAETETDPRFAAVTWLNLHEETEGLKIEDASSY